jgi:hypothetical protein
MIRQIPFVLLLLLLASGPAHAQLLGGIWKRQQRPEPTEKVPELIQDLKGADRARSRTTAADELRQYDANQFPEAVRALIHSLENDANPTVRAEAAQSLSRMRPVTQAAGQAVERAASKDPVLRVRWVAWYALKSLQLAGYKNRGPAALEEAIVKTPTPVQQQPNDHIFVKEPAQPTSTPIPSEPVVIMPPANSLLISEPEPAQYSVPRPLPIGAPWSTAVPNTPRRLSPPELINEAPLLDPPATPTIPPITP